MARNPTDMLGSFAKGLSVIEAFTAEKPRLTISDAAAVTGLNRAAARRCLLTLTELGYADFDGKNFSLTPRILRLGTSCLATMPLPRIVQPLLDKLSTEIGQSTSVSILDHGEIVYVARAAQQRLMSINLMAGSRLPASCTSMGRVLLADLSDAEIRKILRNIRQKSGRPEASPVPNESCNSSDAPEPRASQLSIRKSRLACDPSRSRSTILAAGRWRR